MRYQISSKLSTLSICVRTILLLSGTYFLVCKTLATELKSWEGVYSSPVEVEGFSKMVLHLYAIDESTLVYRMIYKSDFKFSMVDSEAIEQDIFEGRCMIDGDSLYLPIANGVISKEKIKLDARVIKLVRTKLDNKTVLMRDEALEFFSKEAKVNQYGVYLRVTDKSQSTVELEKIDKWSLRKLIGDNMIYSEY